MSHIFKDMINIKECQIYQPKVDTVIFRIVRGANYTQKDEDLLLCEARKRLGNSLDIQISYEEKIERTKTGKLRFVISEIPGLRIDHWIANSSLGK